MKKNPVVHIDRSAFMQERVQALKTRVRILSVMLTFFYIFANAIQYFFIRHSFNNNIFGVWVFMVFIMFTTKLLTKRANSMLAARQALYFFIIPLLFAVMASLIFAPARVAIGGFVFAMSLLTICFVVPLNLLDVAIIGLIHFVCLITIEYWGKGLPKELTLIPVTSDIFVIKAMLLVVSFAVCLYVRKKDNIRDLEAFSLMRQIKKSNRQLEKELELATEVHKSLIPQSFKSDMADVAITYLPMHFVGGDYAKFYFINESKLIFIISDITGHGVSSALLVNRLHSEVERLMREGCNPGALLKSLDTFVKSSFGGTGMYLSAFCGLIDYESGRLYYSNYGHPPQMFYQRRTAVLEYLKPHTTFLGLQLEQESPHEGSVVFASGDRIILYTDGVIETAGSKKQRYGIERLEDMVRKNRNKTAEEFSSSLMEDINGFRKGEIADDIFISVIDIK